MPLNSQTGPLAMPWTRPVAISVVGKIFDKPPPAARPAGGRDGGVGEPREARWASALGAAVAAASAAPAASMALRPESGRSVIGSPPRQFSLRLGDGLA